MNKKKYTREEAMIEVARLLAEHPPHEKEVTALSMDKVALNPGLLDAMTLAEEIDPKNVYNVSVTFIKSQMPDGSPCLKIVDQSLAVVGVSPFPPLHEMLDPEEAQIAESELIGIMLSGNCKAGDRLFRDDIVKRREERAAQRAEDLAKNAPVDKSEEVH